MILTLSGTIMPVITATLIVTAIAAVLGAIIVLVFHFFSVEADPKEADITEMLPGANCGGCGYSGCSGYAAALASGAETEVDKCAVGGEKTMRDIATYLGQAPGAYVPKVALVHCQGSCDKVSNRYQYEGSMNCKTASELYGGPFNCQFGCVGLGDCSSVCEYDAIHVENGVAKVDPKACMACGACAKACPRHLIHIEPKYEKLHVNRCSNPEPGKKVRVICTTGCIGCTLCMRKCPSKAIHMEESLAVIDQNLCTQCGTCSSVCPAHSIVAGLE